MDQWTPQRRVLSTYGSAFRRRRSFHRVGLGIAASGHFLNRSRIDLRPSRGDRHLGLWRGSGNRVVEPLMPRRMVGKRVQFDPDVLQ